MVGSGVYGLLSRNDSEFYLAPSLYRSVDVSRLTLIRDASKRGVMCPLWDVIDTPCLIRGLRFVCMMKRKGLLDESYKS